MLGCVRIVVVVASQTGRTRRMAEAFVEGARGVVASADAVELLDAETAAAASLETADAIVLGSGVHMGGVESAMRAFLERTAPLWLQGKLVGRIGAAFVSAGAGGRGGAELALVSLHAALAEHGLLLVTMHNRIEGFGRGGSHFGPLAWTRPRHGEPGPTEGHLQAAQAFGAYVAQCASRWRRGAPTDD